MDKVMSTTLEQINALIAKSGEHATASTQYRHSILHAKKLIELTLETWKGHFPREDFETLKVLSNYLDERLDGSRE